MMWQTCYICIHVLFIIWLLDLLNSLAIQYFYNKYLFSQIFIELQPCYNIFHLFFFYVFGGVCMPESGWSGQRKTCRSQYTLFRWDLQIKLRSTGLTVGTFYMLILSSKLLNTAYFSRRAIISKIKLFSAFMVVHFHFLTVIFLDVNIAFWDRSYWKKVSFLPIDSWYSFSWRRALISSQTPSSPLFNY